MITTSYSETLFKYLKDKNVEVYCGDNSRDQEYADFSVSSKSVIRGKLVNADGNCLMIETTIDNKSNIIYINCRMITAVIEPKNKISIVDVYCDESARQDK
jgi:hypothetical protein